MNRFFTFGLSEVIISSDDKGRLVVKVTPRNLNMAVAGTTGLLVRQLLQGMAERIVKVDGPTPAPMAIPQNVNYAVKSSYILPLLDEAQNLPVARSTADDSHFEDVVATVQKSVVLILVY